MWIVVEPKESGEEPECLANLPVVRRKGWQSLIHCEFRREAEELATKIRLEGFDVNISESMLVRPGRSERDY